jgi:hypothetical protein
MTTLNGQISLGKTLSGMIGKTQSMGGAVSKTATLSGAMGLGVMMGGVLTKAVALAGSIGDEIVITAPVFLLLESGDYLLLEDGTSKLQLEG